MVRWLQTARLAGWIGTLRARMAACLSRLIPAARRQPVDPGSRAPADLAAPTVAIQASSPVLVVDLDGSLLRSDALFECLVALAAKRPLRLLALPFWLLRGRSFLKARLAECSGVGVESFPWRASVLQLVRAARQNGRTVVLATASDTAIAHRVAAHLPVFDAIIASDGTTNRKGWHKLAAIRTYCGPRPFDYIGDSRADRVIWRHAAHAIVVGSADKARRLIGGTAARTLLDDETGALLPLLLRALRIRQWAKNLLLLVPALFAGSLWSVAALAHLGVGIIAFGLVASAIYLVNDLLDLEDDRAHRSKRDRPFASGRLDLRWGVLGAPVLLLAGFLLASMLASGFLTALACYVVANGMYNAVLKRVALLDVLTLALLYSLRLIAGAAITDTPLTEWFVAFSGFIFLSLALAKRATELIYRVDQAEAPSRRRGYVVQDLRLVESLGSASGNLSVLVLALYIQSPDIAGRYASPTFLWLICPVLLFWVNRVWLIVNRGEMADDPVEFGVRDRVSWCCATICLLLYLAAAHGPGIGGG